MLVDLDRPLIPSTIPLEEEKDERIIDSMQFIIDDEFVNTHEFKYFWMEELKDPFEEELQNFDRDKIK